MSEQDWGLRFLDLCEADADAIVAFGEMLGFEGFTSDPHITYESLLDREGVVLFQKLVIAALSSEQPFSNAERWGGENTLFETPEWLEHADPVSHPIPELIRDAESFSWGVKLMGLTEGGAATVSAFATEHGMQHVVVDPSKWQELGMDWASVEIDRTLVLAGLSCGVPFTPDERARALAMLKTIDRWLAQAVR